MNRLDKLAELGTRKASKEMVIVTNGEPFVRALEAKISQLKDSLNTPMVLSGLDKLSDEIGSLQAIGEYVALLQITIDKLSSTISNIPDNKDVVHHYPDKLISSIQAIKPVVKILKDEDIYTKYKAADTDEKDESKKYYGFVSRTEEWFILRELGKEDKMFKYTAGSGNYMENWRDREKHDYQYFYEVSL